MRIAVTSTGPTLDDQVEARFGRCSYFLIVDTDSMEVEAWEWVGVWAEVEEWGAGWDKGLDLARGDSGACMSPE